MSIHWYRTILVEFLSRPNRDLRQFYQCNMFYFSILKICASDTQIHRIYIFPRNLFGQNTGFPRNSNDRNPCFPRFLEKTRICIFYFGRAKFIPKKQKKEIIKICIDYSAERAMFCTRLNLRQLHDCASSLLSSFPSAEASATTTCVFRLL